MPKVSIVVPVCNVEMYLEQCIGSILAQTLKEIEIICVDDGSTDSSGEILDRYAGQDERIRVLHRENAGYGAAMNAGMRLAAGEYIGIVESDDRVAPDMFERMYEAAKRNDLDFVKSDAYYWFERLDYRRRVHDAHLEEWYNQVLGENERNLFFDFFMNIWTGIYKREFLLRNQILFHESPGASYQDNGFWMLTCCYAQRAMWIDEAFYDYRQDNPQASVKSPSKMMAMTGEYDYLENLLKERKQERLLPYVYAARLIRDKGTFYRIEDRRKYDFIPQIREDYGNYKAYVHYNGNIDIWMRNFLRAPLRYCDQLIQKKLEVITKIQESVGVVIYGAGKQGDTVMRILYNEGLYHKILCFAVSDDPKNFRVGDREVLRIRDAQKCYPDAVYLLAAAYGSGAYLDMQKTMDGLGIREYLQMTDFLGIFHYI